MKALAILKSWKALLVIFVLLVVAGVATYFLTGGNWALALTVVTGLASAFVLWLIVAVVLDFLKARVATKKLEGALAAQPTYLPKGVQETTPAELKQKFEASVQTLRETLGKGFLYELPWYMIIGESGSGKSTSLRKSTIRWPLGGEQQGIGGTVNCDWWFANDAVLLDTAGRFAVHDADSPVVAVWENFLGQLKKARPRRPIDGVVVVIPANELIAPPGQESKLLAAAEKKAEILHDKLSELQRKLQIVFPVYVLITKCDKIKGFEEFFTLVPPEQQATLFGWSNPHPTEAAFDPNWVGDLFENVEQDIARVRERMLKSGEAPENADLVFLFPEEFRSIRQALKTYLEGIFDFSRYEEPHRFRGVYFSSGGQDQQPISALVEYGKKSAGRRAAGAAAAQGTLFLEETEELFGRPYFVRDFYLRKVFKESGLARPTRQVEGRVGAVRRYALGAAVAVGVVATIFLVWQSFKLSDALVSLREPLGEVAALAGNRNPLNHPLQENRSSLAKAYRRVEKVEREGQIPWIADEGLAGEILDALNRTLIKGVGTLDGLADKYDDIRDSEEGFEKLIDENVRSKTDFATLAAGAGELTGICKALQIAEDGTTVQELAKAVQSLHPSKQESLVLGQLETGVVDAGLTQQAAIRHAIRLPPAVRKRLRQEATKALKAKHDELFAEIESFGLQKKKFPRSAALISAAKEFHGSYTGGVGGSERPNLRVALSCGDSYAKLATRVGEVNQAYDDELKRREEERKNNPVNPLEEAVDGAVGESLGDLADRLRGPPPPADPVVLLIEEEYDSTGTRDALKKIAEADWIDREEWAPGELADDDLSRLQAQARKILEASSVQFVAAGEGLSNLDVVVGAGPAGQATEKLLALLAQPVVGGGGEGEPHDTLSALFDELPLGERRLFNPLDEETRDLRTKLDEQLNRWESIPEQELRRSGARDVIEQCTGWHGDYDKILAENASADGVSWSRLKKAAAGALARGFALGLVASAKNEAAGGIVDQEKRIAFVNQLLEAAGRESDKTVPEGGFPTLTPSLQTLGDQDFAWVQRWIDGCRMEAREAAKEQLAGLVSNPDDPDAGNLEAAFLPLQTYTEDRAKRFWLTTDEKLIEYLWGDNPGGPADIVSRWTTRLRSFHDKGAQAFSILGGAESEADALPAARTYGMVHRALAEGAGAEKVEEEIGALLKIVAKSSSGGSREQDLGDRLTALNAKIEEYDDNLPKQGDSLLLWRRRQLAYRLRDELQALLAYRLVDTLQQLVDDYEKIDGRFPFAGPSDPDLELSKLRKFLQSEVFAEVAKGATAGEARSFGELCDLCSESLGKDKDKEGSFGKTLADLTTALNEVYAFFASTDQSIDDLENVAHEVGVRFPPAPRRSLALNRIQVIVLEMPAKRRDGADPRTPGRGVFRKCLGQQRDKGESAVFALDLEKHTSTLTIGVEQKEDDERLYSCGFDVEEIKGIKTRRGASTAGDCGDTAERIAAVELSHDPDDPWSLLRFVRRFESEDGPGGEDGHLLEFDVWVERPGEKRLDAKLPVRVEFLGAPNKRMPDFKAIQAPDGNWAQRDWPIREQDKFTESGS